MLFQVRNYELVKDQEKTFLTAASAVAATTLTVKAIDSNAWADNDWIIVGEIGQKNAEILQINGAVSDGTSVTIDNAGSGGARFAHSIDEPVYRVSYNQVEFSRATTEGGTKTVLATNELQVDDVYTRYEDTANTTGWGFVRFYNSTSTAYSAYSDGIPYTGYPAKSLGRMTKSVRRLLNNPDFKSITDDDIKEEINNQQRNIAHERLWPFFETIFSDSTVAYQKDYSVNSSVVPGKVHTITWRTAPLRKIDAMRHDILGWDTSETGDPTHALIWNNKIKFYPTPTGAAQTTTLDGALTAAAVSITVVSTSGFSEHGRILIDSEVISYSTLSSTQFLGCIRGEEGTTAATHTTTTAVAERDIVYTAHTEPTELTDVGDLTLIPNTEAIETGAAAALAIGKMGDKALYDRLTIQKKEAMVALRDDFGRKFTSRYMRIKDKEEVVSDGGSVRNPNDYAQITGA